MLRFRLNLNCDGAGCAKGVGLEGLSFGDGLREIQQQIQGWTQDGRDPNLHYCPACSEKRPASERLRSQLSNRRARGKSSGFF